MDKVDRVDEMDGMDGMDGMDHMDCMALRRAGVIRAGFQQMTMEGVAM